MHVCLLCIELFGDSIYGGFGRATRFIGRELVKRGVRVSVVVPRRSPERPDRYHLDGMEVHQFPAGRPWTALRVLRACGADVHHSQDPSSVTVLARWAAPGAAHVVTLRDPMDASDWRVETRYAGLPPLGWLQYRRFIDNPLVTRTVRSADALYCPARFLIPKATRIFGLRTPPGFLPSPVEIPEVVRKAARPTVCFVGRWEGRKRVEAFFELARSLPAVDFVALGGARDPRRDAALRVAYGKIPNLALPGVIDQFTDARWSDLLGRSWILVNTSAREGLPTTFVEAAAHRCAILSFTDPDGFASRFGFHAAEGSLSAGLRHLLEQDRWRARGEEGWRYVSEVFSVDAAMAAHLAAYDHVLAERARRGRLAQEKAEDAAAAAGAGSDAGGPIDVTVIVCTRDRLDWLRECVKSVLGQQGVSFELLIVDDTSSDGTRGWLASLADPRTSVLLPSSQLLRAGAANLALARARGRHVMFLDDDDLLRPGALRVLASALDAHPEAVAAVGARWVWFTAEAYQRRDAHPRRAQVRDVFDELLFGWSAVSGQNLYRTEAIRRIGGYAEGLSPCDDRDLWLRVAALGKVALRPETVVTYRAHPWQWRPENLRQIRERVARRAIRALPAARRRYALRLRRSNRYLDEAEDAFMQGPFLTGLRATFRAVATAPAIYGSPLVGEWIFRRLAGRIARRIFPPPRAG